MSVEGRVSIDVTRESPGAVRVSFSQPGDVSRVLEGKTRAEVLAIVPLLFSLCSRAQAHAARLALDAAEGRTCPPGQLAALQCLTEMESLRENTLRIALDWSRQLGESADTAGLKELMRLVPDLDGIFRAHTAAGSETIALDNAREEALSHITRAEDLLAAMIFGERLADWQARRDIDGVLAWAAGGRTAAARLLHRIHSQGRAQAGAISLLPLAPLDASAVQAWLCTNPGKDALLPPSAQEQVPETTLLSRHAGDPRLGETPGLDLPHTGLGARMTARLIELAELPGRMRDLIEGRLEPVAGRTLGEASAMSEVLAARGLLIHAAAVERGRISRYRVLAPTRWNFDAQGAAARAVGSIASKYQDDAQILCELMVNAIDPCVAYSVRIH
jgi:hypothetical protein